MKYYAVIDTNVLVSAMLKWQSVPGTVMSLVFSHFCFCGKTGDLRLLQFADDVLFANIIGFFRLFQFVSELNSSTNQNRPVPAPNANPVSFGIALPQALLLQKSNTLDFRSAKIVCRREESSLSAYP